MVESRARAGKSRLKKVTLKSTRDPGCRIVVLGIGGAGNNAVNRLLETGIADVKCIAMNTDLQELNTSLATRKVLIGEKVTRGAGTGGDPSAGRAAIEESRQSIDDLLKDVEVVFIAAGLGGGTGTSAGPVVAELARRKGAVVVGFVTITLGVEKREIANAAFALIEMQRACDTVVVIDSNKFDESVSNLPINEIFKFADQVSANTMKGILDSISGSSLINLDLTDFKTIVRNGGMATVIMGESDAPNRAEEAVRIAFKSSMVDVDYAEATSALVHISGDSHMKIEEANRVGSFVTEILGQDAIVKLGARTSSSSDGFLKVTLVMTGVQSPKALGGFAVFMPKLYDIESSYSESEKRLQIDLGLDQIESFEE